MGYIDNNLLVGEKVVYRASLHWIIYLPAAAWTILAVFVAFLFNYVFSVAGLDGLSVPREVALVAGAVFLLFAIFSFCGALIRDKSSDFAVTNKRIIFKTGVISRNVDELMLTKCEGIKMDQGVLGRILGYGTLMTSTGEITNVFRDIKNPSAFRKQVYAQIDIAQNHEIN